MFPPQATLPTTFRWLSKTQRTACEILEFLRETKCPLNSQKNNLQNNIFFFFYFYLRGYETFHNPSTLTKNNNKITFIFQFIFQIYFTFHSFHKCFYSIKKKPAIYTSVVLIILIITSICVFMLNIQFFIIIVMIIVIIASPGWRIGTTSRLRRARRLGAALPERARRGTCGGRREGAGGQRQ